MKWKNRTPICGEIIRTPVGSFYHYGIYKSEDEVIQFGKNPILLKENNELVCVCCTSMLDFLCNNSLEVLMSDGDAEYDKQKTLNNALSRLGEEGYHILYNNCEHFVFECAFQKRYSSQIDELRRQLHDLACTDLYISPIPSNEIGNVLPVERQDIIDKTTNFSLKRQRYYVWKLLEYALKHSYNLDINEISFMVDKNGKWHCNDCFFSLSHCNDAVAVAVSKRPVGVDIENLKHNFPPNFAQKVLTKKEFSIYESKNDKEKHNFLMQSWCAKESIFKSSDDMVFHPQKIEHSINTKTGLVEINGNKICYAVCCNDLNKIKIFNNINL